MGAEYYIALSSEMSIETQFEKQCDRAYRFRYINTMTIVAAVEWDENILLFTEELQIMNKVISCSNDISSPNRMEIYSKENVRETASVKWKNEQ